MTTAIEMVAPHVVALSASSSVRVARLALLGTPTARLLPVERSGRVIGVLHAQDVAAADVCPNDRIMSYVRPVGTWVAPDIDWMDVYSILADAEADLLVGDADNYCGQLTPDSVLRTMPLPKKASNIVGMSATASAVGALGRSIAQSGPCMRDVVLVVEDDEMMLSLQMLVVEEAGLRPMGAATLEGARAVLDEFASELALILLDVHLPDGSGIDFGGRVTSGNWPAASCVPIVIVSATGDLDLLADALYAGSIGHFRKPFQPLDLLEAVRAHAPAAPLGC